MGTIKKALYDNIISLQKDLLNARQESKMLKKDYVLERKKNLLLLIEFCDNYENVIESFDENLVKTQVKSEKSLKRIKILKKKYDRILISMGVSVIDISDIDHVNIDTKKVFVAEVIESDCPQGTSSSIEILKKGYCAYGEVLRPVEVVLTCNS